MLEKVYNNDTFKVITRLAARQQRRRGEAPHQQKVKNKACYHVFVSLGAESPKEKKNLKQFSRHMNDAVIVCARVVGRVVAYTAAAAAASEAALTQNSYPSSFRLKAESKMESLSSYSILEV